MKVLHLIPYYIRADRTGGPSIFLSKLAQSIVACGVEVTIVTTNGNLSDDVELDFSGESCDVDEDGIAVTYLRRHNTYLPPTFYYAPALRGWLEKNVRDFDLVIVHGIWTYFNWVARQVCQKAGKPYLVFVHGCLDEWAFKHHSFKKIPYWYLVEKKNFQGSSGVLALSRDEEAQVRALGIQKPVGIVHNQLLFPLPVLSEPRKHMSAKWPELTVASFVFFMSRLHPKKGLDILLEAWKKVWEYYPDWRLVIAGPDEGGYLKKLQAQAQALNVQNSVTFTGLVTGDIKTALLQSAALFVLPSYSEGVPGAVIEALGYGLPVLITPGCHLPEVIEAGAGLIIPPDVKSLAENLERLMADGALRQRMGQQAANLAQAEFDSKEIAQVFLQFCQTILDSDKL